MNQQEFDNTVGYLSRIDAFVAPKTAKIHADRLSKAYQDARVEIEFLREVIKNIHLYKTESGPVSLNKNQIAWLLEYFDGDPSNDPIEVKNTKSGPEMRDPWFPGWGWESVKSEPRHQLHDSYPSTALDWTVDQLTYREPSCTIDCTLEFCDEAVAEIFTDMYIEDCHQIAQLIENVKTEKATPTDVRETGEICLLWVFLENGPA
jgi:hypothetical protein